MITAVSIFSCTNDYDPGLIENLGMKEQPLRIITKVLTTKSPNFMQEFTRGSVIGLHVVSESTGNIYDSNPDYKNVRAEAFLVNYKLNWRQSPDIYLNEEPVTVYAYYPYQSQVNFDPENIPVRISPDASLTKDYMYGIQASGQRAVNQISPVALLNMNHTLSLLSFQLRITPEADWVDAENCVDAEVRLYDNLFSDPQPDGPDKDFLNCLNPDSLMVLEGCKVERAMVDVARDFDRVENRTGINAPTFQFMRTGYFCMDNRDCTADHLVFNRSVSLKDSFKK